MPKTPASGSKAAAKSKSAAAKSKPAAKPKTAPERKPTVSRLKVVALKSPKRATKPEEPPFERADSGSRLLKMPQRVWYKPLTWRYRPPKPAYKRIPKARRIFRAVLLQLWDNKALFSGIVIIYGLLNAILVKGLTNTADLSALKTGLDQVFHGVGGKVADSSISFGYLLLTSGSGTTGNASVYEVILLLGGSLATIWALRQSLTRHRNKVRIRDSFYLGMYPLVPFILVFLILCVQLIPAVLGSGLYSLVTADGIAVNAFERGLFLAILILLVLWSLYMITATLFAFYIVTLPDMTPVRAYKSAKKLVYRRRLLIWRKIVFLPVVLLLSAAVIEIPIIYFLTPIAEWAFFVVSMFMLPVFHGYIYKLYREML